MSRSSLLAAAVLSLALGRAALAGPDAFDTYRSAWKRLDADERAYWKEFEHRLDPPLVEARRAISDWHQGKTSPPENPLAALRALYAELDGIERARGTAALDLAKSGHAKAVATLLDVLLDAAGDGEALDRTILASRPTRMTWLHEPEPAFRREALAARVRLVGAALAVAPGGPAALAAALPRAAQADGKDTLARRVAVIDALGEAVAQPGGSPEALAALRPLLGVAGSSIRIAALEAVARGGAPTRPDLVPSLKDTNPIVRRALLQTVRARLAKDAGWIAPVLAVLAGARAQERAEAVAALSALTRQAFGDDAAAWKGWYDRHVGEIETGAFDAEKTPVEPATAKPAAGRVSFYGLETSSDRVLFLVDGSVVCTFPSDLEFQRKRNFREWSTGDRAWAEGDGGYETHLSLARREVDRALSVLPAEAAFGIVLLRDGTREGWPKMQDSAVLGASGLLAPTDKNRRRAAQLLADSLVTSSHWHAQESGLLAAFALAGMPPDRSVDFPEPRADTVLLVNDGWVRGGRWILPEAVVSAFARANRFRRLVVHAIRISDEGQDCEALMQGLGSGGTYLHLTKPPPR